MIVTDTDPAASGKSSAAPNGGPTTVTYSMTTDIWTTPDVPEEMREIQDFDMRFAQKLMAGVDFSAYRDMFAGNRSNPGMAALFSGKPGAADAFAQMQKEMAKIKGTRIKEITRMGGSGTGMTASPAGANGAPPSGGSMAGQAASDTASDQAGRAFPGGGLAGSLMGAFHKKKATPPPDQPAPAPTTSSAAPGDVTLMEMTTQTSNFSRESAPSSAFEVPVGFSKVASPYEQMMKTK
jgi:hypothetical protein